MKLYSQAYSLILKRRQNTSLNPGFCKLPFDVGEEFTHKASPFISVFHLLLLHTFKDSGDDYSANKSTVGGHQTDKAHMYSVGWRKS